MKICNKCFIEKPINDFNKLPHTKDGMKGDCKACNSEYKKINYMKNRERIISKASNWAEANKDRRKSYVVKYYRENKEEIIKKNKDYRSKNKESCKLSSKKYYKENKKEISEKQKIYNQKNKEKISTHRANVRKLNIVGVRKRKREEAAREASTPVGELKQRIRSSLRQYFKNCGFKKPSKTSSIIGCGFDTLHSHMENTFISNYGRLPTKDDKIHIDHKIPLKTAKTIEDVVKLNHYTNLQWLLAKDNLSKGSKIYV